MSYQDARYSGRYPYESENLTDYSIGRWAVGEGQYVRSLGTRNRTIVGTEYRRNLQQAQGGASDGVANLDDNTRNDVWAVYVQDELRISSLIVNMGIRRDNYGTIGTTTNPRIAAILGSGGRTSLKLLYGRAFRAPNNYELYYTDIITQKPPAALLPERIETSELVVEHHVGESWRVTGSLYQNRLSDLVNLIDRSRRFTLGLRQRGSCSGARHRA